MKFITTIPLLLIAHLLISQTIDFTPYPGNQTHCPGEEKTFTASLSLVSGCGQITWIIENGKIININDNNKEVTTWTATGGNRDVIVKWDDVPQIGKLKAVIACSEGQISTEKTFSIRSLNGRFLQNPRALNSISYCAVLSVTVMVDVMFLLNTGGSTGVTQQRAEGYEWTLPAGWKYQGSTGTVTSESELINIEPTNGCTPGGTVTVKAFVN